MVDSLPPQFQKRTSEDLHKSVAGSLQCFDAVGWAAGRASGL